MRGWLVVPADWRRPDREGTHPLAWCDGCGYGSLQSIPGAGEVLAAYEVDEYEPHRAAGASRAAAVQGGLANRVRVRIAWQFDRGEDLTPGWLERHCGSGPHEICDLGCGGGELAQSLQRAGHHVTGVEPTPAGRAAAAARGVTVHTGTAEELPVAVTRRRFDVVVLSHVLEHCRDPRAALRNVRALLAPGGRAILEVPNNECLGLRHSGVAWHWLDVPRHIHFFTGRSLAAAARAAGLVPVATAWRGYTRQFDAPWLAAERRIAARFGCRARSPLRLLLATLFAPDRRKYDSVRMVASVAG
jgi:SAM-dependent methyltransferase